MVLPAHKPYSFPLQSMLTIPCHGYTVVRQLGNVASMILLAGAKNVGMFRVVFHINAETIEGFHHVVAHLNGAFFLFNTGNQRIRDIPAAGIELNQSISTIL